MVEHEQQPTKHQVCSIKEQSIVYLFNIMEDIIVLSAIHTSKMLFKFHFIFECTHFSYKLETSERHIKLLQ